MISFEMKTAWEAERKQNQHWKNTHTHTDMKSRHAKKPPRRKGKNTRQWRKLTRRSYIWRPNKGWIVYWKMKNYNELGVNNVLTSYKDAVFQNKAMEEECMQIFNTYVKLEKQAFIYVCIMWKYKAVDENDKHLIKETGYHWGMESKMHTQWASTMLVIFILFYFFR